MVDQSSRNRAELIRKGNEAFNNKDFKTARELFTKADYKDGLIRLGDYYMFERRLPLLAFGYYKRAGSEKRIEDIRRRMIGALMEWLGRDKFRPESLQMIEKKSNVKLDGEGMVVVPVSPALRDVALKIIKNNQ
jgi:hypothetical protein